MKGRDKYQGYIASVVSLTAALFMLCVVGYGMLSTRSVVNSLTGEVTMTVMLSDSISTVELSSIESKIKGRVEVSRYQYISKEESVAQFSDYIGHDVNSLLGDNPLPALFSLSVGGDFTSKEAMESLKTAFVNVQGVDSVLYQSEIVDRMTESFARLRDLMLGFAGVLVFVSLILIYNTIRLMIGAASDEIRAMQLVGARRSFICAPYIRRAVVGGVIAGVLSWVALWFSVSATSDALPMLALSMTDLPLIGAMAIVAGVCLCTLFTYISVNQQLGR